MALTKVGYFSNVGTGSTQDITGLGFQPSGVIFWLINPNDTNVGISWGWGASDFTNNVSTMTVGNARASSGNSRRSATNAALLRTNVSGGVSTQATATQLPDGFRLNFSVNSGAYDWGYIAFHNSVQFKVGSFSLAGAGSVTGVGFKPGSLMFEWLPSTTSVTAWGHGFVDSQLNQFSLSGNNSTATISDTYTGSSTASGMMVVSSNAMNNRATVTSYDTDGFTYSVQTNVNAQTFAYVAIGEQLKSYRSIANPGVSTSITDIPIPPELAVLAGINPPSATYGLAAAVGATGLDGVQWVTGTAGYSQGGVMNRGGSTTQGFGRTQLGGAVTGLTTAATVALTSNGATLSGSSDSQDYPMFFFAQPSVKLTQTGNARIEKSFTATQSGNARLQKAISLTQQGNARIQKPVSITQSGNARIQRTFTATQTGNANITKIRTVEQTGNATIDSYFFPGSVDQTGNARIQRTLSITQQGNSRITKIRTADQIGNAFLEWQLKLQQSGNSRITRIFSITQLGRSIILRINQILQTGNARLRRIVSIDIIGNAQITNPTPDKRPQQWEDASTEQPTEWQSQDRAEQIWDQTADKPETPWQNSQETQEQQWSDGDNKQPAEWRRQFYD